MKLLTANEFLDRLREMPDIEAEQELVLRKEHRAMEHAVITRARQDFEERGHKGAEWRNLGLELAVMAQDSLLLNEALKACRKRQDRVSWSKAVRALFGEEGFSQCRVWMAMNAQGDEC